MSKTSGCILLRIASTLAIIWLLAPGAPAAAADLSGTAVTVAADAWDNVGVAGVQFYLNGQPLGAEDRTAPYSVTWDTTAFADGTYLLTAVARDAAGNTGTSAPVTVTVNNATGSDTSPPAAAITSPADGAAVSAILPVVASATDNLGVVGVQFFLDGQPLGPEDTSAPFTVSWNTTLVADGSHSLTARARDAAGNQAFSTAVTVIVGNAGGGGPGDTTPPEVTTTGPANGSTVSHTISITAQAGDNVGVVGVRFFVDGQPIGQEDTAAPYAVAWNTTAFADGPHVLSAMARDAAGNQTLSAGVGVVVRNSAPPEDEPAEEAPPASDLGGALDLEIVASSPGFRKVRAEMAGAARVQLYVDGQLASETDGASLEFNWDVRSLIGSHEVRAVATGSSQTVATASLFYAVSSTRAPSVTLDVAEVPLIRATLIRASADVAGALRLELYIDGELKVAKSGATLEHAWDPRGAGHDILFAVYDALGVVASVGTRWEP